VRILVLAALVLRVVHASGRDSLFCDEAIQLQIVASADGLPGLVDNLVVDAHPPLAYALDMLARAAGLHPRALPVAYGVLTVLLLALVVRRRLGERAALIAAGMVAAGPYFLYFSAQIRSYSLFMLMAVVHFAAALRFAERRGVREALAWGLSAGFLMLTHYYGAFHIAAAGIYLLVTGREHGRIALAAGACLLVFGPWLPVFAYHMSYDIVPWFEILDDPAEAMLFVRISTGAGVVAWIVWAAAASAGWRATDSHALRLALVVAAGGCLAAWVAQHRFGAFQDRYVGPFAVLATVPAGYGLSLLLDARPRLGWAALLLVFVLQQMDARHWLRTPSPGAEIARLVAEHDREGDLVCVFDPFIRVVWELHDESGLPRLTPCHEDPGPFPRTPELSTAGFDPDDVQASVDALRAHLRAGGRVWYLGNGWYPSTEGWAAIARPSSSIDAPLQRRFRAIHARLLRTCYAEAEPVWGWDGPGREYWYPWTVLLFDPEAPEMER